MKKVRQEMKHRIRRRFCSATLAAVLGITSVFAGNTDWISVSKAQAAKEDAAKVTEDEEQVNAGDYGLADNTKQGAILHAWCWSFNTIKENLKDIAEAGFTTVQTSPANTCYVGDGGGMELMGNGKWYYHYQPIDWQIGNYQLGSRDDFKSMCEEADKYGVKIIVDVLPNHTAADRGAVTQNLINAAGGMDKLYHEHWDIGCTQWDNRDQITNYKYSSDGCPDVCTENPGFQAYYVKYLNDLIECGVDGFRYDTAKHIGLPDDPLDSVTRNNGWTNNFWPVALGQQEVNGVKLNGNTNTLFVYGEVLQDQGSRDADYGKLFNLTASNYGGKLRGAVGNKDFNVNSLSNWENAAGADRLVTWVESHDTYCNKHESAWMTDWHIKMAWAVIAARASGTPLFYSRPDGSNGAQGNYWGNNRIGAKGNDNFKDPEVAACNHFRNAMVGESEYLSNPNGNNSVLVIERGTKGAVIINMGSDVSNIKLNKMADGTYTEEVSGKEVQVSGGTLNYTVPGGTIAVVYNAQPITKNPNVSVSKDSGNFTEPFDLTLTPSNATKATYSIDGQDAKEFTGKTTVKIGKDAKVGDKITVKVTAEGEGEPFSKTFTYTMIDTPEYAMYLRVKKSEFDTAPNLYLYKKGSTPATEYNGKWPGKAMEESGDYYIFTSDSVESATAILSLGGESPTWRSTQEGETEPDVSGCMEYSKSANKFTEFTPATKVPDKTDAPTDKPSAKPTPTKKPTPTEKPTPSAKPSSKPTDKPVEGPGVTASLEDGSVFKTETQDVKLTFKDAEKVTYSVDGGPKKTVDATKNKDVTVTLGQGKIGNSEVTLEVESTNGEKSNKQTFKYTKEFVKSKGTSKVLSVFANAVMDKFTEEAESVNAEAESDGIYATNPDGQIGKKASIKIDGDFSDWSEDMLIAQGAACDTATRFKGCWENWVMDSYSLYGAWDDENLYVAWQNVNTYDTFWEQDGNGPLSDSGKCGDAPVLIAINTGKGNPMTGLMADGKGIWGVDVQYKTRVDNVIAIHSDLTGTPGLFKADASGASSYAAEDGLCLDFKSTGIEVEKIDDCFPSKIMGVWNPGDENDHASYDLSNDWVDLKTTDKGCRKHSTAYDTFYEMKIPFSALGITKSDLENNGVGVMQIISRGESGMDCVPHDPSMLDNTYGDYGNEPSNSHEKDDTDIITVPLAALGKSGGVTPPSEKPATDKPDETEKPDKTDAPDKTDKPAKTDKPDKTQAPTTEPTKKPEDDKIYCVNFGADKSSPQLDTATLTLKAEGYDGTKPYSYEFSVDDKVVQASSEDDSYEWKNPKAGEHVIKVVMKDKDGEETISQKKYVIEKENAEEPTSKPTATVTASAKPDESKKPDTTEKPSPTKTPDTTEKATKQPEKTATPKPTKQPEKTATPKPQPSVTELPVDQKALEVALKADKKSSQVKGTKITLSANAKGGSGKYSYTFIAEQVSGTEKVTYLTRDSKAASVQWIPGSAGTYSLSVIVTDTETGDTEFDVINNYKITKKKTVKKTLKYNYFKASKKKVSRKKKITLSASGTAGKGKVQYKFYYKKKGAKKIVSIHKYSTKKKIKWKVPSKKGTYYVYCKIKDGSGKTLLKKLTIKVKK